MHADQTLCMSTKIAAFHSASSARLHLTQSAPTHSTPLPQAMVKQNSLPIVWVKERPARIGLVPKEASSQEEIKWCELPSFMAFHVANAWEEENGRYVKVGGCCCHELLLALLCLGFFNETPKDTFY